jgi:NAD(P)H-dependent FMN reductase
MSTKRLNVVIASTRPGRIGGQVGEWFAGVARAHSDFDVHVVDLAEIRLPMLDEPVPAVDATEYQHAHTRRWSAITAAADAFVFVTPEYNRGYPASIKNALDYLYAEWQDKPIAFVSYGMTSGGMRAAAQLTQVVVGLGMVPVTSGVVVHLRETVNGDGVLVPTPRMVHSAQEALDELMRITSVLAAVRAVPEVVA